MDLRRMQLTRSLRALLRGRGGNVAVMFALSMPVVLGGGAFGAEAGYWYFDRLRVQQVADAAAFAGAVEARAGNPVDVMTSAAQTAANTNGFSATTDTLVFHNPPTSGPNQNGHATEAIVTRTEPRLISQLFTPRTVKVTARAVAAYQTAGNACILALDKIADQAVSFSGNSTITLTGCNVMANSLSGSAIYSQGSTLVSVPCLMSAGGVSINANVTETSCASPLTQLSPAADPMAGLVEPTVSGPCASSGGNSLSPGRYCGGLSINGTTNLAPGTYVVDGGTLRFNGNANITGSGVTFYLANGAGVVMNGNSTLNLTPPTSGALKGVVFFGSRSNPATSTVTLNGTHGSIVTGTVYFPSQPVSYIGDMQGYGGCTQVIAKTVAWSGNVTLGVDCSAYGMNPLPVGGVVRLAE